MLLVTQIPGRQGACRIVPSGSCTVSILTASPELTATVKFRVIRDTCTFHSDGLLKLRIYEGARFWQRTDVLTTKGLVLLRTNQC
jgi:hypothetical protein